VTGTDAFCFTYRLRYNSVGLLCGNTLVFLQVSTDMESFICNERYLEVFWIMDVTIIWSTVPKIYEDKSKSKVNLPVEVLQSTHWETYQLFGIVTISQCQV